MGYAFCCAHKPLVEDDSSHAKEKWQEKEHEGGLWSPLHKLFCCSNLVLLVVFRKNVWRDTWCAT